MVATMRSADGKEVLAAYQWKNNAEMMADVASIWIGDTDVVYDPTYGKGGFWKEFRPKKFLYDDIDKAKGWGGDFRDLLWEDETFDVVVFDPPYISPGGRTTSTISGFNNAYGIDSCAKSPDLLWKDIQLGMKECVRVLRPGGRLMQKAMNYISSATYLDYETRVVLEMLGLDLEIVDKFHLVKKNAGPQPKNRTRICPSCKGKAAVFLAVEPACPTCEGAGRVASRQEHSRNNMSTLIVGIKK